jgi:orotidine-5'-phosphate decarboxylase
MKDRLIVALDVETPEKAEETVRALEGTASFFKIGMWLFFQPGVNRLIDWLVASGNKVFLDYKMFDIGETVKRGVESAARRGISFVTVHGDPKIMEAAVAGRGDSALKVFAISVLTSLDDAGLAAMGHNLTVRELIALRVRAAVAAGCDGMIASPNDEPDQLRALVSDDRLLIATPGIRMPDDTSDDHSRPGTPSSAIQQGADYLVVGRPILRAPDKARAASDIVAQMEIGQRARMALPA